jgi:hypothetical protein
MDAAERVRALHVPHSFGSDDCAVRCEAPHPGVQVCNADDYRWPCPTIQALSDPAPPCQSPNCDLSLSACVCGNPFGTEG